jgi:fibronectin type 3 domain-containing protein
VLVFAVVVCAGTALASPDAREVVTSALGAVARAFGLDPEPGPASSEPESSPATQLETSGGPRMGIGMEPGREQQSVNAADTDAEADPELPLSIGPDREIWPPTPTIPPATDIHPPSSPDALIAISVSSTQIDLAWTEVATETGYRIERSMDGETEWTTLGNTGQDVTTYSDVGLTPGTNYFYRVIASNAGGDSPTSGVTSATTATDPPSPPDGLTATSVSSTQIDLAWTDVATETGYRIERSLDGETEWATIATTGQDITTYNDVELSPGTNYFYRVIASNAGGDSPASGVTSATTATDPPSPPDDLTATSVSSTQIDLAWTDVATETSYRIERSLDGETEWTSIGVTDRDVTKFSDVELSPGTNYFYRVFATNVGGDSHASIVRSLSTAANRQS